MTLTRQLAAAGLASLGVGILVYVASAFVSAFMVDRARRTLPPDALSLYQRLAWRVPVVAAAGAASMTFWITLVMQTTLASSG